MNQRIAGLLEKNKTEQKRCEKRVLCDEAAQEAYARLIYKVYASNRDKTAAIRRAEFLLEFAENFPLDIRQDELIVGSQRFVRPDFPAYFSEQQIREMEFYSNHGHIVVDYNMFLEEGIGGIHQKICSMPALDDTSRLNKDAFAKALEAFSIFIHRHAEAAKLAGFEEVFADLRHLAEHRPESFSQALQMVWMIQVFLHAEGNSAAISFGRFDQYLWPFLKHDLAAGIIDQARARELLSCFFLKCCEGAESQNLTLGGVDENGSCAENLLSILCLEVMTELQIWQPSISVRIAESSSAVFIDRAIQLCGTGIGQPSFFNDSIVTDSLKALDIPEARARDWAVVGCYEASTQGDMCPYTVAGRVLLPALVSKFFSSCGDYSSFDDLSVGFKEFIRQEYHGILNNFQQFYDFAADELCSPFESLCVKGCIESGRTAEEGGAVYSLLGVNVLGLGTLVDSLFTVKTLVFDEQSVGLDDFRTAMSNDFADESLLRQCRALKGKYGTDCKISSELACEYSEFIARLIIDHPLNNGVRPYPGFFLFSGDIFIDLPATPDGRRSGERISYGVGPGELSGADDLTAIINSVASAAHGLCGCGNPLTLSLSSEVIRGERGKQLLLSLIKAYFAQGGFHLHFNVADHDELKMAQLNPELYPELTVRVSGFSAKFIYIDEKWQNAIIERTEKGM